MAEQLGIAYAKRVKADVYETDEPYGSHGFYFCCRSCGNCSPHYPTSAEAFSAASQHVHEEANR